MHGVACLDREGIDRGAVALHACGDALPSLQLHYAAGCTTAPGSAWATSRPRSEAARGSVAQPLRSTARLPVRDHGALLSDRDAACLWAISSDQSSLGLLTRNGTTSLIFHTVLLRHIRWPHQAHPEEPRIRWPRGETPQRWPPPDSQRTARHGSDCGSCAGLPRSILKMDVKNHYHTHVHALPMRFKQTPSNQRADPGRIRSKLLHRRS